MHQVRAPRAAYALLGDRQRAEDVVADTFLLVYERIGQFDIRHPFAPWFYRIVTNGALKALCKSDVTARNLATTVNASRSAYGYTATVDKVYADANVVYVISTFRGPAGRSFVRGVTSLGWSTLINTATNTPLRYLSGQSDAAGDSLDVFSE